MKHASQLPLLPRWTFAWYALNLIVLPFDTTFILLRPTGRVADTVLASFHMYARYDAAAADPNDNVVRYIYLIGLLDIAAFIALFTILAKRPNAHNNLCVAILAVAQSAALATKTVFYILHCWSGFYRPLRVPITALNGIWVLVPALLITHVARAAATVPPPVHRD